MKKVLIVDDEENIRRLLKATLSGGNYELLQAGDGKQAMELIRRERPEFVMLDISMPGFDGIEACRQIKSDNVLKKTTVVMLTAHLQPEVRRRATEAGADAFLTKPFSPLQVLAVVERHVTQR